MSNIPVVRSASIVRGCGSRVKGGLYACCATSPYGKPLEHFLIDPPTHYHGDPFRAPIVKDGNLIFWVGAEHYPYCPDFIEETKLYGVSKRIAIGGIKPEDFLPFKTKMFFVHPKAVIDVAEPAHICPKGFADHLAGADRCITALSYFINRKDAAEEAGGGYHRTIGSTTYPIPKLIAVNVKFTPGIFMWLPLSHFEYVLPEDKKVDSRVEKAIKDGANIVCVEEEE